MTSHWMNISGEAGDVLCVDHASTADGSEAMVLVGKPGPSGAADLLSSLPPYPLEDEVIDVDISSGDATPFDTRDGEEEQEEQEEKNNEDKRNG